MTETKYLIVQPNSLLNERTFLAWPRTSLALIGLGFVVSRFGLFFKRTWNYNGREYYCTTINSFSFLFARNQHGVPWSCTYHICIKKLFGNEQSNTKGRVHTKKLAHLRLNYWRGDFQCHFCSLLTFIVTTIPP